MGRTSSALLPLCLGAAVLLAGARTAAGQAPPPRVVSADGRAELTDPAGDVKPIVYRVSQGGGPEKEVSYPGLDVVKLVVSSDGKAITFAATLAAAPGSAAADVLEFYVDADNNPKTGHKEPDVKVAGGMEFFGTLEACLEHPSFGTTCAGTDNTPSGRTAVVMLHKYGRDWMFKDALIDLPATGTTKEPRKTPITGPLVQSSLDYAALGVKPGQTIRLLVREACAGKVDNAGIGFLPEIMLTLK